MLNEEKLIEWCWENLNFSNNPNSWEETFITDILNGYNGDCHTSDGKAITYRKIREMFTEEDEEDDEI